MKLPKLPERAFLFSDARDGGRCIDRLGRTAGRSSLCVDRSFSLAAELQAGRHRQSNGCVQGVGCGVCKRSEARRAAPASDSSPRDIPEGVQKRELWFAPHTTTHRTNIRKLRLVQGIDQPHVSACSASPHSPVKRCDCTSPHGKGTIG